MTPITFTYKYTCQLFFTVVACTETVLTHNDSSVDETTAVPVLCVHARKNGN